MTPLDQTILANLDPISSLSPRRMTELADLCFIEPVSKGLDPFRMNVMKSSQALYLLKGELGLRFTDGFKQVLRAGSKEARQPVADERKGLKYARALTDLEIVRIDTDLLDIMMTWDQLAGYEKSAVTVETETQRAELGRGAAEWMSEAAAFSADKLHSGVFSKLPPANVEEMFRRMSELPVKAGQTVIMQGAEGDYYYLIESGSAVVTRAVMAGQPAKVLAELQEGDGFGEDALVSDGKRNATVSMKTDGVLLRLKKEDFVELLQAPLLSKISYDEAKEKIASGACPLWLDVRYPTEFSLDHVPGSINVPLNEIRNLMQTLDRDQTYITYCQTGRRSSAAAFILAQHGFKVFVLEGGMRSARAG